MEIGFPHKVWDLAVSNHAFWISERVGHNQGLLRVSLWTGWMDLQLFLSKVCLCTSRRGRNTRRLKTVLQRVKEHKLSLQLPKCETVKQKVNYLGFVLEPQHVSADPRKVKTIQERPEELLTRRSVRGFLGLVRDYRKLIPNFCKKMARPLFRLLKEGTDRSWRSCHTGAVRGLKEALISTSNLQIFDPCKPVAIKPGAAKYASGAVLEQEGRRIASESKKRRSEGSRCPRMEVNCAQLCTRL